MVDALRHFLESFRLPGESPIIARILETFAEHWLVSKGLNYRLVSKRLNYRLVSKGLNYRLVSKGLRLENGKL